METPVVESPRIESMAITLLLDVFDVKRGNTEADVLPTLNGGVLDYPDRGEDAQGYLEAMLRTSIVFALPPSAAGSADEALMQPGKVVLPPLPYQRVFFEFHREDDGTLCKLRPGGGWSQFGWTEETGPMKDDDLLLGGCIEEVAVGEEWRCCVWLQDKDDEREITAVSYRLRSGDDATAMDTGFLELAAAYYLDALDRYVYRVGIPRGHRRAHERRRGFKHPTVYFVSLDGPGGKITGESDRVFTVRWLVRGHWRKFRQGRKAGERVWIKSYIKGPDGAPFKGRPLYFGGGEE